MAAGTSFRRGVRRRRVVWLMVGVISVVLAACGGGATGSPQAALRFGSMQVDGFTRVYRAYVPPSLPNRPVPLLVALHGGQQYGDAMEQLTGFDSLAEADQFIVVYPNGHGQTWNAGNCCGFPNVSTTNEVDFISALITRLSANGRIDPKRVYVTGFSAGAAMAHTIGCRLAGRIAAVASVAGTMDIASCRPASPVSVLEIHGTADVELLYGGGGIGAVGGYQEPATPDIMAAWASLDGCSPAATVETSGSVQLSQWTGCAGGSSVLLDTVEGGSHNWYEPSLGGSDGSLDATQAIWQFLSAKHR